MSQNLVTDDDYLEGIAAEAEEIEFMDKEPPAEVKPTKKTKSNKTKNKKKSNKQTREFARFENGLKEQYPASYQLYLKLDNPSRISVFDLYQETGKYSEAKGLIMNLFFRR